MNTREKKATKLYVANKQKVFSGAITDIMELSKIARQQDRLYLVIHARQDARIFNKQIN